MGNIMTAFLNKTPLILVAGQQTREMLIGEPMLANRDAEMMPKPWVKWAYQPVAAKDVPAALVRAIATATMPPAGKHTSRPKPYLKTTFIKLESYLLCVKSLS